MVGKFGAGLRDGLGPREGARARRRARHSVARRCVLALRGADRPHGLRRRPRVAAHDHGRGCRWHARLHAARASRGAHRRGGRPVGRLLGRGDALRATHGPSAVREPGRTRLPPHGARPREPRPAGANREARRERASRIGRDHREGDGPRPGEALWRRGRSRGRSRAVPVGAGRAGVSHRGTDRVQEVGGTQPGRCGHGRRGSRHHRGGNSLLRRLGRGEAERGRTPAGSCCEGGVRGGLPGRRGRTTARSRPRAGPGERVGCGRST